MTAQVFDLVFSDGQRSHVYHVFQNRDDAEAAAARLRPACGPGCTIEVRARPEDLLDELVRISQGPHPNEERR